MFKFAAGVVLIALGLSMGVWEWLFQPSATSIPFIGLALIVVGGAAIVSHLRKRRSAVPKKAVAAAGLGVAVAAAGIYALLKELEEKKKTERAEALMRLKQLEAEYMKVRDRLTPEQRRFFEEKIEQYRRALS